MQKCFSLRFLITPKARYRQQVYVSRFVRLLPIQAFRNRKCIHDQTHAEGRHAKLVKYCRIIRSKLVCAHQIRQGFLQFSARSRQARQVAQSSNTIGFYGKRCRIKFFSMIPILLQPITYAELVKHRKRCRLPLSDWVQESNRLIGQVLFDKDCGQTYRFVCLEHTGALEWRHQPESLIDLAETQIALCS